MEKMNEEVGRRWVAALRSGEYPQSTGQLRTDDGYCCLGVLCEIAVADGVITSRYRQGEGRWGYGAFGSIYEQEVSVLPRRVVGWAGLEDPNPVFVDEGGFTCALAELNDGYNKIGPDGTLVRTPSASFAEIADVIERHFLQTEVAA